MKLSEQDIDKIQAETEQAGNKVSVLGQQVWSTWFASMRTIASLFLDRGYSVYYAPFPFALCWHEGGLGTLLIEGLGADDLHFRNTKGIVIEDRDRHLRFWGDKVEVIEITRDNLATLERKSFYEADEQ
jgi:hypothetical protein